MAAFRSRGVGDYTGRGSSMDKKSPPDCAPTQSQLEMKANDVVHVARILRPSTSGCRNLQRGT
ncbi:unnamed protein product [Periconia digitata]|uniref:Uncharacterized protein n=1 Tax=Periconia digitata TaxID=1303443 RepID=A0A9W4UW53_9PLEO|nr:unnamed protein product [Periconia digitata]